MNIGILYDEPRFYPINGYQLDQFAEFEPNSTLEVMSEVIEACGFNVILIPTPKHLPEFKNQVDLIWNISEGYGSRNREAWGPILGELNDIPFIGSDAYTLTLCLDKATTKLWAQRIGIQTAPWDIITQNNLINYQLPQDLVDKNRYLLKPRYEGTAKGITPLVIAQNLKQIKSIASKLHQIYNQDILIEEFLPGAEYTCALIGKPMQTSYPLERAVDTRSGLGLHVLETKGITSDSYILNGELSTVEEAQIREWSLKLCHQLDIKHFARLDFKRDINNKICFLEVNPLPTFAIDSTFAILAELENISYVDYLASHLKPICEDIISTFIKISH